MSDLSKVLKTKISAFKGDNSGGATTQIAVLFGAAGIAMAVLLVPMINDASENYAFNKAVGIDTVTTASIKKEKKTRRHVRKSVLD